MSEERRHVKPRGDSPDGSQNFNPYTGEPHLPGLFDVWELDGVEIVRVGGHDAFRCWKVRIWKHDENGEYFTGFATHVRRDLAIRYAHLDMKPAAEAE